MPAPETGRFPPSREWKWGEANGRKKNLPFRRKPESHSRDSENFPRSGTLHCSPVGECGCRRRDSGFRGNGRKGGNGNSFFDKKRILTLRRLRGGVRARSGRGGWRVSDDCRHSSTPQKFAGANFYPPPQAAEGETIGNISHSRPPFHSRSLLPFPPPSSIPA